jgi:hypothetical protein
VKLLRAVPPFWRREELRTLRSEAGYFVLAIMHPTYSVDEIPAKIRVGAHRIGPPGAVGGVGDPVEWGIVDNMAHPGGNITGVTGDIGGYQPPPCVCRLAHRVIGQIQG